MTEKRELQDLLRQLPAVDQILKWSEVEESAAKYPRTIVLKAIREVLEEKRKEILSAEKPPASASIDRTGIIAEILLRADDLDRFTLVPVINATGIIVHTNLGRSLLADEAWERLKVMSQWYSNLEYDLDEGHRGSRYIHAEEILCELTGAEGALVVNNNAGAVLLVLNTLAEGKEVIVSRGQLVEIGGSFRIPDVMARSGAHLHDVGCTNKTHLRDYEQAINPETALIMKVHNSNYMIIGFTSEVPLADLADLAHKNNLFAIEDLGSGSFIDLSEYGLRKEPTAQEAIQSGVDTVTFSGDKLLGGPQAGIILGKKELIARFKKNPLTRALRIDKLTLAALEATLRLYRDKEKAALMIPTLRMITAPLAKLEAKANRLKQILQDTYSGLFRFEIKEAFSQVGGGALPGQNIATKAVAVTSDNYDAAMIERVLRRSSPPIIGRIEHETYLMDVRTLKESDFPAIHQAFSRFKTT